MMGINKSNGIPLGVFQFSQLRPVSILKIENVIFNCLSLGSTGIPALPM